MTGAEGNVLLPGQAPLAKVIETISHGQASRIYLEGEGRYKAEDATYTTCPAGDSGQSAPSRYSVITLTIPTLHRRQSLIPLKMRWLWG
jgi:hypothetical protein